MSRAKRTKQFKQRKKLKFEFFPNNPNVVWTFELLAEQFPDLEIKQMLSTMRIAVKKNRLIVPVRLNGQLKIIGWIYDPTDPTYGDKENTRLTKLIANLSQESDNLNRAFEPRYARKLKAWVDSPEGPEADF